MGSIDLGGLALVMMVETTEFTNLDHVTFGAGLCSSELQGVFAEGQMSTPAVVIGNIRSENTTQGAHQMES